jgi:predicted transcriptional regulator
MLTVETIGRIRREHLLKGKTIKEIARDLKVSRNTVRRVLRSGATSFEYEREVQPRPKLGRWTAELVELLTSNAAKAAREQLTLIRVFEELRGRGDLFVSVTVVTPTSLTREQRKLLEQLAPVENKDLEDRGLVDKVRDIFG